MMTSRTWSTGLAFAAIAAAAMLAFGDTRSAAQVAAPVAIDSDDIGGVVTGAKGPEAGVWVVAESTDLPTRLIRTVVTDDQGRYVVPDLPKGRYRMFVRGYGLIDSPPSTAAPGQQQNLKAVTAPTPRAAANIYPANYWLGLMEIPAGKLSFEEVASTVKNCLQCHQIGNMATRTIGPFFEKHPTHLAKWDARVAVGPSGSNMSATFQRLGPQREAFARWTERIANGEFPKQAPPRPRGVERNLVVTQWTWATPVSFTHTAAASDKRNPLVNPNGRVYGPDRTSDSLLWLDPVTHQTGQISLPTRDADVPRPKSVPSPYWGTENIAGGPGSPRSGVMDEQGRVYVAHTIRAANNQPAWCRSGSTNKFAQYFPLENSNKHVAMYDPKTQKVTLIDTCFRADHNDFGPDPDNPLYFGQNNALGWISMKTYDQSADEQKAQGWCPAVLDTNGDGRITKPWTEPDAPTVPDRDRRIEFSCYEVAVNQLDGSAWCSGIGTRANGLVRLERGPNPPETCKAELYLPPENTQPPTRGDAGGAKVDRNGIVWQQYRGNDIIFSFDRRKCKALNGPNATGQHCPEGWTAHRKTDLPTLGGSPYHADLNYLMTADTHNALGLGANVPITYPNNSDSLLAYVPQSKEWVTLRVPYPLGFYTRQAHARIDDPNAGWKGRAFWSANMSYAVWHIEGEPETMGGKGQRPMVLKFQFRPDPLAK